MGFDLKPRNKKLEWFHFGAFSWGWMMDEGVGYIINCGPAKDPASFSFVGDKKGRCPKYNDGYYVSADLAWAMGRAALGLASVHRHIIKEWDKLSPEKRAVDEKFNETHRIYKRPGREDFIDQVEQFGVWAQKSSGFGIF